MPPVAGVDNCCVNFLGKKFHGAGIGVPDDQYIGMHRIQRHRRVDHRLALFYRAGRDRHIHDIAAKPLAGEFEGGLRPGRVLEEQIDDRAAAQYVAFFVRAPVLRDIGVGEVQDRAYFSGGKAFDTEKISVREAIERNFRRWLYAGH